MIYTFQGKHTTFRRCFAAWQQWDGREFCSQEWPNGANIQLYHGEYNIIENGIAFGGVPKYNVSMGVNGPAGTSIANRILGTISIGAGLNWDGSVIDYGTRPEPCTNTAKIDDWLYYRAGFSAENIEGAVAYDNIFRDIFSWGNGGEGIVYPRGSSAYAIDHATIISNLGVGRTEGPNPNLGPNSESRYSYITNSYIEGTQYQGEGARLAHRYVDGVLTDEPLWPWPMEARIQAEMGISVTDLITSIIFDLNQQTVIAPYPQDAR
jgi:hypothetical protein